MKKRKYYAVSYGLGLAVCARSGRRYDASYHVFLSKQERDEWVSEGGDFRLSRDWREALPAKDSELRFMLRHDAQNELIGYHGYDPVIFHINNENVSA